MKLHLGCGEKYLKGYLNIDYSRSKHTVQQKAVADKFADILDLKYPPGSISEIRLHHVFEHFSRVVACMLLTRWYGWLKPGGVLRIEVPDFETMAKIITSPFSFSKQKDKAVRHIFGSQEASWATHFTGYTRPSLKNLVELFGFRVTEIRKNSWRGTHNIELFAVRKERIITPKQFEKIAEKYLSCFLIDNSVTEKRLLKIWMEKYHD